MVRDGVDMRIFPREVSHEEGGFEKREFVEEHGYTIVPLR